MLPAGSNRQSPGHQSTPNRPVAAAVSPAGIIFDQMIWKEDHPD